MNNKSINTNIPARRINPVTGKEYTIGDCFNIWGLAGKSVVKLTMVVATAGYEEVVALCKAPFAVNHMDNEDSTTVADHGEFVPSVSHAQRLAAVKKKPVVR